MPSVHFNNRSIDLCPGETVLDGMLRAGVTVPHSCRAGACQSCLMRATEGVVPTAAQSGLKDTRRAQGYFLACQCVPEEDLTLASPELLQAQALVEDLAPLSDDVMRVRLRPEEALDFHAGQFMTLLRDDGLSRSYSIASLPAEGLLELHVRRVPGGRMSTWIHDELQPGTRVRLIGPHGDCFYASNAQDQPLLLAGTGTGLAPLYGILRAALEAGHSGPIRLYHGGRHPAGLYLVDELNALANRYENLAYRPCVLAEAEGTGIYMGALDQYIAETCGLRAGWRAYLCGDPGMVNKLRRKIFLAGVAMKDIYADAFVPSPE